MSKVKFMSVKTIFAAGGVIGLLTGIAIMYLMNGILGHASMREGLIAFVIFQGTATITLALIFKRTKVIWNLPVHIPLL